LGEDSFEAGGVPDKVDAEVTARGPTCAGRVDLHRAEFALDESGECLRVARRGELGLILVHQDNREVGRVGADSRPRDSLCTAVCPALGGIGHSDGVGLGCGEEGENGRGEGEEMHVSSERRMKR